jgi:hypothetical protein
MLQWYRATVEHTIGFLKRFKILSTVYRGRVTDDASELSHAIKVIIHMSAFYISSHHRRFNLSLTDGVDLNAVPDLSDSESESDDSSSDDDVPFDGFNVSTWDPAVGTALTHASLQRGMRIEVYMNSDWWAATVTHVYPSINRVNVKLVGADTVTRHIMPKHIRYARV